MCPHLAGRDDRKSAAIAAEFVDGYPGGPFVDTLGQARSILRHPKSLQNGPGADEISDLDPEHIPVFYLDGEPHRKRRAAIAQFFTPKAIANRYQAVMERVTHDLLQKFGREKRGRLDDISFELAVAVAADIIGLTNSRLTPMANRLATLLALSTSSRTGLAAIGSKLLRNWYGLRFMFQDVRPAIKARQKAPGEDIISQTLEQGYSQKEILVECMTYASAGMLTTREFITMVAWHLLERPDLKTHFLEGDEKTQFALLREILRIEPIATLLWRRDGTADAEAPPERIINVRQANLDEAVVGGCPYAIDPDRAQKQRENGDYMSFGDGNHRCPGAQVALHESRVFLMALLSMPGIRMERAPDIKWNASLMSYELRNAIIACD